MAEGHRCLAPKLCTNDCGSFGSPAMLGLRSNCYRDLQLKEQRSSNAMLVLNQSLATSNSSSLSAAEARALSAPSSLPEPPASADAPAEEVEEEARTANRCGTCRGRVGLTGFKCGCGGTFCGTHRYPEQHGCGFDFKEFGREEIKRANPVVKAEKLNKI